jgi:hypothetical protein
MEAVLERIGGPKSQRVVKKINTLDENKVGILHYAARYEQLQMVKLLVYWGADVNIRGDDGLSPLHFAARLAEKRWINFFHSTIADPEQLLFFLFLSFKVQDYQQIGGATGQYLFLQEVWP